MMSLLRALRHPRSYRWFVLRPWKRHSLVLMAMGSIFICMGWTYILTDPTAVRTDSLRMALNIAPLDVWGGAFIISGVMGMLSARWPEASERWGYTAMSGIASWWACCYLVSVILGWVAISSLTGFFLWASLPVLLWAISGLDNPHEVIQGE